MSVTITDPALLTQLKTDTQVELKDATGESSACSSRTSSASCRRG